MRLRLPLPDINDFVIDLRPARVANSGVVLPV
jgi:hypothetical protein